MGGWAWDDGPQTDAQRLAATNGARQVHRALELIRVALDGAVPFRLTVSMICEMHAIAMDGLVARPGVPRSTAGEDNRITGSRHVPPPSDRVADLLEAMCRYCNDGPGDALHLAAYALWRLNWIHPFSPDGNGRTARVVALIVLFVHLGVAPAAQRDHPTFLERLAWYRLDYHDALEAADAAHARGDTDVSALEALLERLLLPLPADVP